ncbi:uncharacterized protein LOC122796635 [Protopterus annectens]|uniref:uncharacterized protein LOC122796635 n=1 Tax=Protopterus annectens TaxID=7888 RepID=UPI001CFB6814|nr:uncharacterized protein LOC122796635 [Protopterus annectens]XP_043921198.1 uncharacterized protein LOC122796635 [Protopterus annectens]
MATDGLPVIGQQERYHLLALKTQNRPVHVVYFPEDSGFTGACEILQRIAYQSRGSFYVVTFSPQRELEQVMALSTMADLATNSKCCGLHLRETRCCNALGWHSNLLHHPYSHVPVCTCAKITCSYPGCLSLCDDAVDTNLLSPKLMRGLRVLARKEKDGYYYLGNVCQDTKEPTERVLVEFDKCKKVRGKPQYCMQETAWYDIIQYENARRHPIGPGHRVLAPWEKNMDCYGPGTVLQGSERRDPTSEDDSNDGIIINFWNGKTHNVPPGVAVWIPLPLSERIILELQMPLEARQNIFKCSPDYPRSVTSAYRTSGSNDTKFFTAYSLHTPAVYPTLQCHCSQKLYHMPTYPLCPCWANVLIPIRPTLTLNVLHDDKIPGTNMTIEELNKKVQKQLSLGGMPVSEYGSSVGSLQDKRSTRFGYTENKARDSSLDKQKSHHSSNGCGIKISRHTDSAFENEKHHKTVVDKAVNTSSHSLMRVKKNEEKSRRDCLKGKTGTFSNETDISLKSDVPLCGTHEDKLKEIKEKKETRRPERKKMHHDQDNCKQLLRKYHNNNDFRGY